MTSVCQGLSSFAPGGGKMKDPGNEVDVHGPKIPYICTRFLAYDLFGDKKRIQDTWG